MADKEKKPINKKRNHIIFGLPYYFILFGVITARLLPPAIRKTLKMIKNCW